MKLYNIFENIILESVRPDEVIEAIDKKRRVNIEYDGDDEESKGRRTIDPYAYGLSKNNNPVIRAYQVFGDTSSEVPKWKLFRLDRIIKWEPTGYVFKKPVSDIDPSIPDFNPLGDELMNTVYKIAKF